MCFGVLIFSGWQYLYTFIFDGKVYLAMEAT